MSKLRQSLQHWQAWESAYEDLREEIEILPGKITSKDAEELVTGLDSKILTEKEVRDVFGLDRDLIRSTEQVTNLLSRRIEYVRENVASLQKQLSQAEGSEQVRIGGESVGNGEARDEEGLPVTEIFEELDEDGNFVSGRVSHPAENAEEVIDSLRRAGVEDAGENGKENGASDAAPAQGGEQIASSQKAQRSPQARTDSEKESSPAQVAEKTASTEQPPHPLPPRSVSFAEGTKEKSEEEKPFSTRLTSKGLRRVAPASHSTSNITQALPSDSRAWEVDENDKPVNFTSPHIPHDESPEDAQLRREMLQYSMAEVGAIVAELELEEDGGSDGSYSDDDEDDGDDALSRSSNDSDEDIHGMSRRSHLTDEYRDEMLELEKKLNAQMVQNVGPRPDAHEIRDQVHVPQSLSKSQEGNDVGTDSALDQRPSVKEVRFADDLDIDSEQQKTVTKTPLANDATNRSRPDAVRDSIIERNVSKTNTQPPTPTSPAPKVSKFKAARLAAASNTSNPPPQQLTTQTPKAPLANNIVERPVKRPKETHHPPQEPDELDPELLKREVQADYYRQRNHLIRKQGGYKTVIDRMEHDLDEGEDENEDEVITESSQKPGEIQPPKKVSLFKAARVNADRVW